MSETESNQEKVKCLVHFILGSIGVVQQVFADGHEIVF